MLQHKVKLMTKAAAWITITMPIKIGDIWNKFWKNSVDLLAQPCDNEHW